MKIVDFLEAQATPPHIDELYTARDALVSRYGKREHRFSDDAMHRVRQDPNAYLLDPSVSKYQLTLATMIGRPEGTRFARIYDTMLNVYDVVNARANEFDLDLDFLRGLGPSYSSEQRIDMLYDDTTREPGGMVLHRFPPRADSLKGRTEDFPPTITVADYMTLGHLIQHDLKS